MKLKSFFFLFFLLFFEKTYAQNGQILGKVSSKSEEIAFANVVLKNTKFGTSTDSLGNFSLKNIPFGTYQIQVSAIGYEIFTKKITLQKNTQKIAVELHENQLELGEVVISGTMKEVSKLESPVPVELYSPAFFRANPTPSVFESLQNINGVRPQINCNICNTGDIHINGLEGPYTMVMIDGMPIVSGLSTVYGLTGIPQALIERTEIVKGAASTLYGSEAVGGLINLITKKPENAPIFSADIFGTSWGEINTDLGLKWKISPKTTLLTGLNYFNYQNPIDNNHDGFTDISLQNRFSIFNKINFERKNNRVFSVAGRYIHEDRWGGQMHWNRDFRGGNEVYAESIFTNRWEFFGNYDLPLKEKVQFQFSANGHKQNSFYGTTPYLADQYVVFGQLIWQKNLRKHDFLSGLAYRYTFYDDNTPATANEYGQNMASRIHLPAIFVQDEIRLDDQNKLLLGIRYDYNSLHGNIFTPRLNYKWNSANKKSIFRLSIGNGYRVANVFTEDHAALTGARKVVFTEKLKPETSWNSNINFIKKIYTKNDVFISLDATTWFTYFTNRIVPDYETDVNKIIYANLNGYAISKGISINTDISFPSGFKILGGATLMDVSLTENGQTKRQLLTEQFTGVWTISYTFLRMGLSLDYTGNLYSPMRLPLLGELDQRSAYSDWYSIQNIQFTKSIGKAWEIYGGIKNILNFTPPANSIARAFDPFDKNVKFDENGQVMPTPDNPQALSFDANYVFASNQGIRTFVGFRYLFR